MMQPEGADSPTFKRKRFNMTMAYLFSGLASKREGFAAELGKHGVDCVEFDIVDDPQAQNLVDEEVFQNLMLMITSGLHGLLIKPPRATFSILPCAGDGGPQPPREPWGKELFCRSDLKPHEKEQARVGTLLALRSLRASEAAVSIGIPVIHEHPLETEDKVSVYHFPQLQDPLRRPRVRRYDVVPCESVAPSMRRATVATWMVELEPSLHERQVKGIHGFSSSA